MANRNAILVTGVILASLTASAVAQELPVWRDPSPHQLYFVTVEENVRLEVLDWGGSGWPIVLLAGLGNTAHVFDGFAMKLARYGRVYGVTRRGVWRIECSRFRVERRSPGRRCSGRS
jgi:non-heme chloroperoxidase